MAIALLLFHPLARRVRSADESLWTRIRFRLNGRQYLCVEFLERNAPQLLERMQARDGVDAAIQRFVRSTALQLEAAIGGAVPAFRYFAFGGQLIVIGDGPSFRKMAVARSWLLKR